MTTPFYIPQHDECAIFEMAYREKLPVLLKGPTGCGKSRLVEYMAHKLDRPLISVAANEDTSAVDLVGRYLIEGGQTVWQDGPVTRAMRLGGMLYVDEFAEARADVVVVLHPLSDHRRTLYVDRHDEEITAPDTFMLVASYNPGYQHSLKEVKPSTRQRFVTIRLEYPEEAVEIKIVCGETQIDESASKRLVKLARKIREADSLGLAEAPSTRLLVHAARLMNAGLDPRTACKVAVVEPLTDDPVLAKGLQDVVALVF
jgi:nitric oxide reductase NorQ protein